MDKTLTRSIVEDVSKSEEELIGEKGGNIMVQIKVLVREDLFDKMGIKVEQAHCSINDNTDIVVNAALVCTRLENSKTKVKCNICNKSGDILHILQGNKYIDLSCRSLRLQ